MHRTFYMGFGAVLLILGLLFAMFQHFGFFLLLLVAIVAIGVYDVTQKHHTILRNFPVLGHIRFIFEFFGPEIRQYIIADDLSERPFDRERRSVVYCRSKRVNDTTPFGTERDTERTGYEWMVQSLSPIDEADIEERVKVGGPQCSQPYEASHLNISAMSFGALSANAILALNLGAKIGGFYHNTGEGGLSDHHLQGGGDVVWQIGTAYFGCRTSEGGFDSELFREKAQLEAVKMIEIKISQGAKPGHGGILPAAKITKEIAEIRGVGMDHDVVSPAVHSTFSTPEGLLEFVQQLRELSGGKPIGFKICLGRRSEFMGIVKAMLSTKTFPDFITVDGAEGGTGAAPLEYSNHVGVPLNDALAFVHSVLVGAGVRKHIRLIASGKVLTGFDMISKMALGADILNSARGMMLSLGCLQSRQCNLNTCPTGVATQNPRLSKGLVVALKKIRVANFHEQTVQSFLSLMGTMGASNAREVSSDFLMRRISQDEVKRYTEIYEWLEPNALVEGKASKNSILSALWETASAKAFV